MDAKSPTFQQNKKSRPDSRESERSSRDSREMFRSGNFRKTQKRDNHRRRREIPESQCISLFPSVKNNSDENISDVNTPQNERNKWAKTASSKQTPPNRSHLKIQDLSKEFPPLGVSSYTPELTKDWGSIVDEEEEGKRDPVKKRTNLRFKRKLLLSESRDENLKSLSQKPVLTDPHKLLQRQKQIDIGKNTLSYGRYTAAVPREQRTKEDPNTPDKFQICSTRSWVGQVKLWRRKLHIWDPPSEGKEDLFSLSSQSSIQSFSCEGKMEVDSYNGDADDDMMSTSTPSSIDDVFGDFDLDACLMNDGLPL